MLLRVLIAVSTPQLQGRVRRLLDPSGTVVQTCRDRTELWEAVARENFDLVILGDRLLQPDPDTVLQPLTGLPDSPEIVVLTQDDDDEARARLTAAGCYAVLSTTLPNTLLRNAIGTLTQRLGGAQAPAAAPPSARPGTRLSNFVSASPAMQRFMHLVQRVVNADTSLLITGETGVGKEWLARAIHGESPRGDGPFVAVNCGALPDALLESELFGHEEGAFTGATRARRGQFELAHGGTLFLDEIGEMPVHLQVKLLRALQSREIQRIGGERPLTVDVRVMAATNRDLEHAIAAKEFRKDLYYRLGVVTLALPPLRERREDIPELVDSYLGHFNRVLGRDVEECSAAALEALCSYAWPGNVRELINVIERAVLLSEGDVLDADALPEEIRGGAGAGASGPAWPSDEDALPEAWLDEPLPVVRDRLVDQLERAYLRAQLRRTRGRVGEAAERAGITSRALHNKMRRLGLRKESFRRGPA